MNPKRQVAIMVAVFSALGIGVSVAIIAFGGGFAQGGPTIFNPPTSADIYVVGSAVRDGLALDYTLTGSGPQSSLVDSQVAIKFAHSGDSWSTTFNVANGTQTKSFDIMLSKQLTNEGQPEESIRPFLEPVESTILTIRDMDYGGRTKYLVAGAPWNTIFFGPSSTTVRVANEETVQTSAGTFNAFVLTYKLKDNTSKIWIVKDLPLPIKAQVYDQDDNPLYEYELTKLAG